MAGFLVADLPGDLIADLDKPLDPVVAVNDRQDVFLGGRAEQAITTYGYDGRIPGHVGAGQVFEQVKGVDLILKARLGMNLGLVLFDIGKGAVDRIAVGVRAERGIAG